MAPDGMRRRAGYGPYTAVVGERGAHTRLLITAEALRQFEEYGYHETSVDGIAKALGISRPTLYQYFESKQDILAELLRGAGQDMKRLGRRLGPLGPTRLGFDNLHWWVGEWAYVYDKHATVHTQWAVINTPDSPLRPMALDMFSQFYPNVAARLESSNVRGIEPLEAANALVNVLMRYNFYRNMGFAPPRSPDELLGGLAVCLQLMLFPDTPARVLDEIAGPEPLDVSGPPVYPVFAGAVSDPVVPGAPARPKRRLGPRGERTRLAIMDAGARLFTERGYYGTNVDDLLAELGLSRGSFYKYFADKADLLLELGEELLAALGPIDARFAAISPEQDVRDQLREWFLEYLPVSARFRGVIRAFLAQPSDDQRLRTVAGLAAGAHYNAIVGVLRKLPRTYRFDADVATLVVMSMLEPLPSSLRETRPRNDPEMAELMSELMTRALFTPGEPR